VDNTRESVTVDRDRVGHVMRLYGPATATEAVDVALRRALTPSDARTRALALEGAGWDGNLDGMRANPVADA